MAVTVDGKVTAGGGQKEESKPETTTPNKEETKSEPTTRTKMIAMGKESLVAVAKLADKMLPTMIHSYHIGMAYYVKYKAQWDKTVPSEVNYVILGLFLCLFGGNFPALIATATAIQQSGQWHVLKKGLSVIVEQFKEAASVINDSEMIKKLDKNGDGVVSLEEIAEALREEGKGLIMTAMPLVLAKVDPNVMNDAITSIWAIWCSVMLTLQSVFARQIAMGMKVGEIVSHTAKQHINPIVASKLDKNYKIWADYAVLIGCKLVGVMVAMFLAKLIGGFMSAMQGGEIIAASAITTAKQHNIVLATDTENLKSILVYIFGGLGFYYQLTSGFSMPIILQILFAPASIGESVLGFFVYSP